MDVTPFATVIAGPRVTLTAVGTGHTHRLREIRAEPEVFHRWGPVEPDFPFDEDASTPGYAVLLSGEPGQVIGFVQFHLLAGELVRG